MRKTILTAALAATLCSGPALAQNSVGVGVSDYVVWAAAEGVRRMGLLDGISAEHSCSIKMQRLGYLAAKSAFTAEKIGITFLTTMDALQAPVAKGVPVRAIALTSYSGNGDQGGNDMFVVYNADGSVPTLDNLTEGPVPIIMGTVTHYLGDRAQEIFADTFGNKPMRYANVGNESVFTGMVRSGDSFRFGSWPPYVIHGMAVDGAKDVIHSGMLDPGEILDMMVSNGNMVAPNCEAAAVDVWLTAMEIFSRDAEDPDRQQLVHFMAEYTKLEIGQVEDVMNRTTTLFPTPQSAIDFANSEVHKTSLLRVHDFLVRTGTFEESAVAPSDMHIVFNDGTSAINDTKQPSLVFDMSHVAAWTK